MLTGLSLPLRLLQFLTLNIHGGGKEWLVFLGLFSFGSGGRCHNAGHWNMLLCLSRQIDANSPELPKPFRWCYTKLMITIFTLLSWLAWECARYTARIVYKIDSLDELFTFTGSLSKAWRNWTNYFSSSPPKTLQQQSLSTSFHQSSLTDDKSSCVKATHPSPLPPEIIGRL